jgi:Flp pilus assembly protein TadG
MICRRVRDESGQGLVELALVLPVLLALVLGILEFGRAYHLKNVVTDAAREGARLAVVQDPLITQDSVKATILTRLHTAGILDSAITVTFDTVPPPGGHWRETGAMQTVYVGAKYRFGWFGLLFKALTGSEWMTIASLLTMRNE